MGNCITSQSQKYNANYYLKDLPEKSIHNIQGVITPTKEQIEEMIQLLVLSWDCNELDQEWQFLVGSLDPQLQKDILREESQFYLIYAINYGLVYTIRNQQNKLVGIVLIYPPNSFKEGKVITQSKKTAVQLQIKKCGYFKTSAVNKCKDFKYKYNLYNDLLDKMHLKYGKEEHWFLDHVAVLPKYQKQGYGTKLVNLFNSFLQKYNIIGYCASNGAYNRKFFSKNGFRVIDKIMPGLHFPKDNTSSILADDGGTSIMINEPWGQDVEETNQSGFLKESDLMSI